MNNTEVTNSVSQTAGVDPIVITTGCADGSSDVENHFLKQERIMKEIAEQVKQQQTLTSALLPTSCLHQQYAENPNFIIGINILEKSYSHIRTIRGDGNCYYRAFLYSLLEALINEQQQHESNLDNEGKRLLHYITTKSWEDILQQNYDEVAIEIFHDEMVDLFHDVLVKQIYNNTTLSSNNNSSSSTNDHTAPTTEASTLFHERMNEENSISDYCTWYLRLITATYMKQDPDRFLPFILSITSTLDDTSDSSMMICDIHQFCSKYIEPMGQECEHVQVLALAEAFQIHVTVVYLDGRQSQSTNYDDGTSSLQHHQFGPDKSQIRLTLLYRPGHYDILYKK
jgi:ubiquitin thioesterase protein OTUB1